MDVNESTKRRVNERPAQVLSQLQRVTGFDAVALDFEHDALSGSNAFKAEREPRKITASGRPVVVSSEGLFIENLELPPEGATAY